MEAGIGEGECGGELRNGSPGGDAKRLTKKWESRVGRLRINVINLRVF